MADLATTADVENAWRPLTDTELTVAETMLSFASAIIRQQVRDIDTRMALDPSAADYLDPVLAKHVAVAVVRRFMLNPDGWRSESIEDFSRTRDSALSAGMLYLTPDELALLSKRGKRAFSVAPSMEPATCALRATAEAFQREWREPYIVERVWP